MAQVRRTPRYRSPPPRPIPSLPNPIRIQLPTQTNIRIIPARSQNDYFNSINNAQQSLLSLTPSSNQLPNKNNNTTDESVILPQLNLDDDDAVLVRKHLPVYAEFPFDVSRLSQPMEINIEDNIHKLRLRLIESELNHQRRSTNEYIKRTHRIGMDSDLPNNSDIEQDFNLRRMQESRNQRRRSNQLMVSNYTYDNRLHLQSVNEEPVYRTSNMDDLIDSMARRHLAHRRLDAAIDRQRRGNYIESLNTGQTSYRNDNLLYTNRSSDIENDSVLINPNSFNQRLRSRIDYYNRIQPDVDSMVNGNSSGTNSHKKLPPISPRRDTNHRKRDSSASTLYDKKNHHNSSDRSEHDIDLPSDIFLSSRTKKSNVSPRNRKIRRRSISKDTRSGTDRSDGENEIPPMTNRHKKTSKNDDDDGFFTESTNRPRKKSKIRRNLFRKAAIGILFLMTLKHRSIKTRTNQLKRSPSATIHKIRLQEIIVALHRVYLEPDGPIFNALIQAISNPISLEAALNSSSKNYTEAIKTIGNALKNIISKITDFMPKDGILGTGKTSAVSVLIQDGNRFPENYFWQCERKLLEFDGLKVINITKQRAILLLIGIFIFRALVTTLLIKPIKYRLILGQLKPNQSISLKVLASVILYIGRRVVGSKSQILTLPHEWQLSLYSDAHIQAIIQHSEIKSIIDTCEKSLRIWCEEYIRRIDESYDKKLRI